jgi:hypothetical protein
MPDENGGDMLHVSRLGASLEQIPVRLKNGRSVPSNPL